MNRHAPKLTCTRLVLGARQKGQPKSLRCSFSPSAGKPGARGANRALQLARDLLAGHRQDVL
jgi:hypothetical protein